MSEWEIFVFALVGRLLDMVSTRMLTPTLLLEGNRVVRRFGWLYAWITLSLALVAFALPSLGIIVGTASCLMAWSNMSFVLLSRYGVGEQGLRDIYAKALETCSLRSYLAIQCIQFLPLVAISLTILVIGDFSLDNDSCAVGYGILVWIFTLSVHKSKVVVRKSRVRVGGISPSQGF